MSETKNDREKRWIDICNEYLRIFCAKHDYDIKDTFWVGGDVGNLACLVDDVFVDMSDIRYDVDNNIQSKVFDDWYSKLMEYADLNMRYLNYPSFCKGAPQPKTEKELEAIKEAKKKVEDAKRELENLISDNKYETF